MEMPIRTIEDIVIRETRVCDRAAWLSFIHRRGQSRATKFEHLIRCKGAIRDVVSLKDNQPSQALRAEINWLQMPNHHLIPITDPNYPERLRHIPDPPLLLYAIGDIGLLSQPQIAIVGSRKPTPIGHKCAEQIAQELASFGLIVTSGMALGIDGIAGRAALSVAQGKSIAVLAHGLDTVYPLSNQRLFKQLCSCGLVISEYPIGVGPTKYRFPERNRIVSGLSLGVVIVEAAERSGTLVTARLALEQSRELMVVPGSALSAQYRGSHRLIQQGAAVVCSAQDIIQCLASDLQYVLKSISQPENGLADAMDLNIKVNPLLQYVGAESTSIDDIIQASGLSAAEVSSALLSMELQGQIAVTRDGGFVNLR